MAPDTQQDDPLLFGADLDDDSAIRRYPCRVTTLELSLEWM